MQFIDIIIFGAIAAFLVFRLRGVLGRRTGQERPPFDPYSARRGGGSREGGERKGDTVISLPGRERAEPGAEPAAAEGDAVSAGLAQIGDADPSFDKDTFVAGASAAFEMIVASYASGDKDTLRPLLSDEVFDKFAGVIDARAKAEHSQETTLVAIRSTDIVEASMDGKVAFLTVKFITEQINVTRDTENRIVEGDPSRVATVTDIWTFARNTRSRNLNWTLVATDTSN